MSGYKWSKIHTQSLVKQNLCMQTHLQNSTALRGIEREHLQNTPLHQTPSISYLPLKARPEDSCYSGEKSETCRGSINIPGPQLESVSGLGLKQVCPTSKSRLFTHSLLSMQSQQQNFKEREGNQLPSIIQCKLILECVIL